MRKQNQLYPPQKKVDEQGNVRKRIFVKSGNSTILLAKDVTENAAIALDAALHNYANRLGIKLLIKLICVQ